MTPAFQVLTIAGSDSGAGAGVQADARTIHALGGFAVTAITAVTAQNTRGVTAWEPVAPKLIGDQIKAVLEDFPVKAVKTGLVPGAAAISQIASTLPIKKRLPLVVDPVIGSTSGTLFLDRAGIVALMRDLLPLASVVTPNWPEAAVLSGTEVTSHAQALAAGKRIMEECGCAVLVKGGHGGGKRSCDHLVTADGFQSFDGPRIATANTHGTGCVLSAAIAAGLAQGRALDEAVFAARRFLDASLRRGRRDPWGGRGPALGV